MLRWHTWYDNVSKVLWIGKDKLFEAFSVKESFWNKRGISYLLQVLKSWPETYYSQKVHEVGFTYYVY